MKLHEWQQQMRADRKSPWLTKIANLEQQKLNLIRLGYNADKIEAEIAQLRYNMNNQGGQK